MCKWLGLYIQIELKHYVQRYGGHAICGHEGRGCSLAVGTMPIGKQREAEDLCVRRGAFNPRTLFGSPPPPSIEFHFHDFALQGACLPTPLNEELFENDGLIAIHTC
jgi:hypothetical protein